MTKGRVIPWPVVPKRRPEPFALCSGTIDDAVRERVGGHADWHAAPTRDSRTFQCADFNGYRLSVRRVSPTYWRAFVDGQVLGCWQGLDAARATAEVAVKA